MDNVKNKNSTIIVPFAVVCLFEVLIGYIVRESVFINQDIIDVLFIVINVLLGCSYVCYKKIPYRLMCNIYAYAVVSVVVVIVAYCNPNEFITFFRNMDAYTYHYGAIAQLHGSDFLYSDTYTKWLALLYGCFGESYRIGVGANIVISMISSLFLYKTLKIMEIKTGNAVFITSAFLFLPWKWEFSLFPMREALPTCLLSISLYFFIKWYLYNNYLDVYVAMIISLGAMMFHSGLIFIPFMYVVSYVIYDPMRQRIEISFKTICKCVSIGLLVICICGVFWDEIFYKMPTMEFFFDESALSGYSDYWTENDAGSGYLQWLSYGSIQDVIVQSPLRALYFALAPVPWEWRGIIDMISFVTDAGINLYIYYYMVKNGRYVLTEYKLLMYILLIMFTLEIFMYGVTTYNSGTALRHRAKFEVILFIIYAINVKFARHLSGSRC